MSEDTICFHGDEVTCDMVSPEHADAMGFIYQESQIEPATTSSEVPA